MKTRLFSNNAVPVLNINIGGSDGFGEKEWHGSADLDTPIQPPPPPIEVIKIIFGVAFNVLIYISARM